MCPFKLFFKSHFLDPHLCINKTVGKQPTAKTHFFVILQYDEIDNLFKMSTKKDTYKQNNLFVEHWNRILGEESQWFSFKCDLNKATEQY